MHSPEVIMAQRVRLEMEVGTLHKSVKVFEFH